MRDFRLEIDQADDVHVLRSILADLAQAIDALLAHSYEDDPAERQAQYLQLILEYGERRLERLLN